MVTSLQEEFSERFHDLRKHSLAIELFASPFSVDVETIPEDMQMEIIELQCNNELRNKYGDSSVYQFYNKKHFIKHRISQTIWSCKEDDGSVW